MTDDEQFNPIETSKEIVIYRGGWGFLLPNGHAVRVNGARDRAAFETRDGCGGFYGLERIDDADPDELRVFVAPGGPSPTEAVAGLNDEGYPFPTMKVELDGYEQDGSAPSGRNEATSTIQRLANVKPSRLRLLAIRSLPGQSGCGE